MNGIYLHLACGRLMRVCSVRINARSVDVPPIARIAKQTRCTHTHTHTAETSAHAIGGNGGNYNTRRLASPFTTDRPTDRRRRRSNLSFSPRRRRGATRTRDLLGLVDSTARFDQCVYTRRRARAALLDRSRAVLLCLSALALLAGPVSAAVSSLSSSWSRIPHENRNRLF